MKNLPSPPPDKTGWPWTEDNQPLPQRMTDGSEWPKISIVTPSYNYGRFIEETIRSVLLQGYPNLEYIIIDGGSTDETINIIKKYEKYLSNWVSEPDKGQTDAINKGYEHCSGDIFVWLNADDAYAISNCLQRVAEFYMQGYQLICGEFCALDLNGNEIIEYRDFGKSYPVNFDKYLKFWSCRHLPQPAVFVATELANKCFPLDIKLQVVMDYQFFLRVLSQKPKVISVNQKWVNFKYHGQNKCLGNLSEDFNELSEISHVALLEASQLPWVFRKNFEIDTGDYKIIHSLIRSTKPLTFFQFFFQLISRPTLARWPLFWKTFAKNLLGKR
ncbi:glycosyltransferase family 2 protein [[Phormidium] sp. LEGE 05292]|uniref:glycosyltransferase family 2 protein n=1 Tax=[Phormidium] sp. LEGE 05292 TaxID=767427 RepID=UPI001D159A02|nr:glycosyltransferase family 2 protein [Phormidium sp. LEGE 05292]